MNRLWDAIRCRFLSIWYTYFVKEEEGNSTKKCVILTIPCHPHGPTLFASPTYFLILQFMKTINVVDSARKQKQQKKTGKNLDAASRKKKDS